MWPEAVLGCAEARWSLSFVTSQAASASSMVAQKEASTHSSHTPLLCQGAAAAAPAPSDTYQAALLAAAKQLHPAPLLCCSQAQHT